MSGDHLRESVMARIEREKVRMRPRWHFIFFSAFGIIGSVLVLLTAAYVISLGIFFMRMNGAWYAPSFGERGWFVLMRNLPWVLIVLVIAFAFLLEVLVRRYRFVYQRPLALSLIGIVMLAAVGGFALERTPLHRALSHFARRGDLPPPIGMWYGGHPPPPPPRMPDADFYRGYVASTSGDRLYIVDESGESTTTVIVTPRTRFPYGADFASGALIIVIGDTVATNTVQAFGIRAIDDEREIYPPRPVY